VIVSRNINACWVLILMISQSPSLSRADGLQSTARPLGVYAKVDVEDAISGFTNSASPSTAELHGLVRTLYADLLANPAISGITVGQHWDHIELYDPTNSPDGSAGYDWSYLDDAFAEANAANKSVQLIITPGVDSPPWLLTNIPSCDGLLRIQESLQQIAGQSLLRTSQKCNIPTGTSCRCLGTPSIKPRGRIS
jgi:hypothetical protein